MSLRRWFWFLLVGLPFQFLVYFIYPIIYLYWRVAVYKRVDNKPTPSSELKFPLEWSHSDIRYGCMHKNEDDHNMMTHFGLFSEKALLLLSTPNGELYRQYKENRINARDISGDCIVFWCFAATLIENPSDELKKRILAVADSYFKYLGCLSLQGESMNAVSARCNNFGINYCPDAYKTIGQPAAGPQYYTSAAIFALASKYSLKYKIIFWTHWLLLGGWFWQWAPVLYSKDNKLGYVRDVTMRSLFVIEQVFGKRWWTRNPIHFIHHTIAEWNNPLFAAISGDSEISCPLVVSPWWIQKADYIPPEQVRDGLENSFLLDGIYKVNELQKRK